MAKFKIFKPYFKTHKVNGHPSYIYAENNDEYKYVGITHANSTHGMNNKKLKYNPNSNDFRISYARPYSTHDKKRNYKKKKLNRYKIHKADKKIFVKLKIIIKNKKNTSQSYF